MDTAQLKKEHAKLKKLLKFKENVHATKFIHITSEGAYRASCESIADTYQQLSDVGKQLGILHPVRMR